MKYLFVGGGPSNMIAAILLKQKHPLDEITIIEKNIGLGQKLKMTGNGKCNIAPLKDDIYAYNNPEFVSNLFKEIPLEEYIKVIEEIGIPLKIYKNGYYPYSESAPNVVNILTNKIKSLGICVIDGNVLDYQLRENGILVKTSKGVMETDKIVFATGGQSYPSSGSDGSIFEVLENHGYQIVPPLPSLCPIKVKENVKSIFGCRSHCHVTLLANDNIAYEEDGEVMFKKDGLSGIAIMNTSHFIAHNPNNFYKIQLNFVKDISISTFISNSDNPLSLLLSYIPLPLANYILKKYYLLTVDSISEHAKSVLYEELSHTTFEVDHLYNFDFAQVTAGGVSLTNINSDFSSKLEAGVYMLGEMLDIDGICGGYNLRFAISSAILLVKCL